MGQQTLIYSFVAQGTVILARYTEFTGNFTSIAAQCLQKLPATNNKFTYNCDGHTFNYLVEDRFTFCVVAVEAAGREVPIAFLERVKDDFNKIYGRRDLLTEFANCFLSEFRGEMSHINRSRASRSRAERISENEVRERIWKAPSTNWVKVNSDAAVGEKESRTAVVFRGSEGRVEAAGVKKWRVSWTPFVAEAAALLYAMKLAKHLGYSKVIFEADNQTLINILQKGLEGLSPGFTFIHDIRASIAMFESVEWSFVRRRGNSAAHALAKYDLDEGDNEKIWWGICPSEILSYVTLESRII